MQPAASIAVRLIQMPWGRTTLLLNRVIAIVVATLILPLWANADDAIPIGTKSACMKGPLAEFGQYIGNWKIEDATLNRDGSGWSAGAGARWNFVCIGEGSAIQDFWMPNDGPVGTNLRTYNAESGSWDIAWTIKGMNGFAHIEAKTIGNGNIEMRHKTQIPDPVRKITFYPASADSWNWKLEISTDEGENWTEIYRIKASRMP